MKVLIADDDRVVSHLLSARLRGRGWEASIAQDAMQTVMFAMRTIPDAIVLDINMPGGTGLDALVKLKMSTKTMLIPVIVASGTTDPEIAARVQALGAAAFVPKPIDIDALILIIEQAVKG